ncbi:hypothetical protein [Persicobacter diffluens]|uniref:Uncharacterized protein n=1 Tax=Persicobacter diffluens TaxID=981 RepID=A0AAN4W199_9BACT|nr:hypothetical protein PEDI_44510 [Persicobacter diffluens]
MKINQNFSVFLLAIIIALVASCEQFMQDKTELEKEALKSEIERTLGEIDNRIRYYRSKTEKQSPQDIGGKEEKGGQLAEHPIDGATATDDKMEPVTDSVKAEAEQVILDLEEMKRYLSKDLEQIQHEAKEEWKVFREEIEGKLDTVRNKLNKG